jgi:hypothetical protein
MSMPIAPPDQVVKLALEVASRSPCRSKRGVVLYDPRGAPSGAGHNGPPNDTCPGRAICTGTCSQRAVHAEVRALRAAQIGRTATAALGGRLEPLDLVHVERAADGEVVACDGPSCPGCAAQILDSGFVGGVWLYEGIICRFCTAHDRFVAPGIHLVGDGPATRACEARGSWRRYAAEEFYQVTLTLSALLSKAMKTPCRH